MGGEVEREAGSLEREWWLRLPLVLQSPRAVFAALRDDSDEAAGARHEPILLVGLLAGVAAVLASNQIGRALDDFELDGVDLAMVVFLGALIYSVAAYFVLGALVYLGLQAAGSIGSFRRARHLLAYAVAPLALSLAVWPARIALYGEDTFRSGGSDSGTGGSVFEGIEVVFIAWSAALLVLGVRMVEQWTWPRAFAAASLPLLVPVLALARAYGVL